jgi:hypothetical protein
MASFGRVIGGHYLNATVSPGIGSQLVVQAGLKWRKLNEEQVTAWEEIFFCVEGRHDKRSGPGGCGGRTSAFHE